MSGVEDVLRDRRIAICAGSGGVGKTTTSAALAAGLAARGQRVAVLTIDPAKRLADSLGLEELGNLPGLEELKGSGLLDNRLPPGFAVPMPSDDPTLRDDEDPLEPGDLDLGLAPPPERIEE